MRIDRTFKNSNKVTAMQMEEWAKKGNARDVLIKSLVKNRGDLARVSLELITERTRVSSLTDTFNWLTKQDCDSPLLSQSVLLVRFCCLSLQHISQICSSISTIFSNQAYAQA